MEAQHTDYCWSRDISGQADADPRVLQGRAGFSPEVSLVPSVVQHLLIFVSIWDRPRTLCFSTAMLHLDTPLLELQNTKKVYGTTNNCLHTQANSGPKDTKRKTNKQKQPTPQTPNAISEELEAKAGLLHMPPCTHHLQRVGKLPKLPLQSDPWTHPYLHPI